MKFIMVLEKRKILNRLLSENRSLMFQKALELAQATKAACTSYDIQDDVARRNKFLCELLIS